MLFWQQQYLTFFNAFLITLKVTSKNRVYSIHYICNLFSNYSQLESSFTHNSQVTLVSCSIYLCCVLSYYKSSWIFLLYFLSSCFITTLRKKWKLLSNTIQSFSYFIEFNDAWCDNVEKVFFKKLSFQLNM